MKEFVLLLAQLFSIFTDYHWGTVFGWLRDHSLEHVTSPRTAKSSSMNRLPYLRPFTIFGHFTTYLDYV